MISIQSIALTSLLLVAAGVGTGGAQTKVFSDFSELANPTREFRLGSGQAMALFRGDAAAATLGIPELYTSPPRAWIVAPGGIGRIDFTSHAKEVTFAARTNPQAIAPMLVIGLDDSRAVVDTVALNPEEGFRKVKLAGVRSIAVINLDEEHVGSVDDFGYVTE